MASATVCYHSTRPHTGGQLLRLPEKKYVRERENLELRRLRDVNSEKEQTEKMTVT